MLYSILTSSTKHAQGIILQSVKANGYGHQIQQHALLDLYHVQMMDFFVSEHA